MFVLVCYDISNDRRRVRLHKKLNDFGVPVQFSVFECLLETREITSMKKAVEKIISAEDDVRYYYLCSACLKKISHKTLNARETRQFVVAETESISVPALQYTAGVDYGLLAQVCDAANLRKAWKKVKSNRGCAGVDNITLEKFGKYLSGNLSRLQSELLDGSYKPLPVLKVSIPKEDGGKRVLGIPAIRDRIAQQAVYLIISEIWDPEFSESSFAYRPGRSVGKAIRSVEKFRDKGFSWVLDADIESYFDNIDHRLLLKMVESRIDDRNILRLIESWLKAQIFDGHFHSERLKGIPQGGAISPLLANIYLDYLDDRILDKNYALVRYADDFVVLRNDRVMAEQAVRDVESILAELKLKLNMTKTRITSFREGFEFLGAYFLKGLRLPGERARRRAGMRWTIPRRKK